MTRGNPDSWIMTTKGRLSTTSRVQRYLFYRKTPPLRRIYFGIYFPYKTDFFSKEGGRLKGGVLPILIWINAPQNEKGHINELVEFPSLVLEDDMFCHVNYEKFTE